MEKVWLKQITTHQRLKLLKNSKVMKRYQGTETEPDFVPAVKLFINNATWLLTEMDETGMCFGLCDLGQGFPELGSVHASELEQLGVYLESDRYFVGTHPISDYAKAARGAQRIVEDLVTTTTGQVVSLRG